MKRFLLCAAAGLLMASSQSAHAVVLFSFEPGEPELPFVGNSALAYTPVVTTTPTAGPNAITDGTHLLETTASNGSFGGALSSAFTDATSANAINGATSLFLDITISKQLNFGNIDIHFHSDAGDPNGGDQETSFDTTNLGLFAPGTTHTIEIPLTLQADPTMAVHINPAQPYSFQIDFSVGLPAGATFPVVYDIDSIRTTSAIPEPASMSLLAVGGLLVARRRR